MIDPETTLYTENPVPGVIVGMRGRDKANDLRTVARLWLSDPYLRAGMGCVTTKALQALKMEPPPAWERRRWNRVERYVADLVKAVPAYLKQTIDRADFLHELMTR
jgi:hypothetical protein